MPPPKKAAMDFPSPDLIEGIPLPRENNQLFGHRAAEATLLDAYQQGRMHHAWLVCGEEGIGKATLAFRMARFILANPDPASVIDAAGLDVPPDQPAAIKIAHGTHANILHIQRDWDERGKRFRSALGVDSVRRIIPFLGTTAGEGDWRFVIIDPADDMNRNAANALLKALEEPPAKTLFFLISRSPGRLLPTIRSRCRTLSCPALSNDDLALVLQLFNKEPDSPNDRDLALGLSDGSPRKALEIIFGPGAEVYRSLIKALDQPDTGHIWAVSDQIAKNRTDGLAEFVNSLTAYYGRRIRGQEEPVRSHKPRHLPLATWAELWEKAARSSRDAEIYNLDVRHIVADLLETYAGAVRQRR